MGICSICGIDTKTYNTFGKEVCKPCIVSRKTGIKGHSGMIYKNVQGKQSLLFVDSIKDIHLRRCKKSDIQFVKWFIEHYPESKGIPGRSINYIVYYQKNPIGIIGANSPPLNYLLFNKFFELNGTGEDGKLFVNNNVFRIVIGGKNYATQILKLFRNTLLKDYFNEYGDILKGIVTFVEPPRNGNIYKADNWDYIGETQGISVKRRGEDWFDKQYIKGTKKHIFGIKYRQKDYHRELNINKSHEHINME